MTATVFRSTQPAQHLGAPQIGRQHLDHGPARCTRLRQGLPEGCKTNLTQSRRRAHRLRRLECSATLADSSLSAFKGLAHSAALSTPGLAAGLAVNSAVFLLGLRVLLAGLTPAGVLHSWVLGSTVYSAFGWRGYLLVCLYFILGSAVTKVKLAQKQSEGIAEARSGRRDIGSVWGSGFAAMVCAVFALRTGSVPFWQVGFVASIVSKLSDTVSSEIGKAYGRTTFLVTNLKKVPRGTEGAISLEGTLAGIAAAVAFTSIAILVEQVDVIAGSVVILAAVVANLFESWLGATVQSRVKWLSNDVVNIIQISVAAFLALAGELYILGG